MTDIVKLVNDVSILYSKGLIEKDGLYFCPVCDKSYKKKGAAKNHIDKEDCYRLQDMFNGTEYEKQGFTLLQNIMSEVNPRSKITLSSFRKSKSYGQTIRFILFTSYHDVTDKGLYYSWMNQVVGMKHTNKILTECIKESRLRDFRRWLQKNPDFINSDEFLDKFKDDLITDPHFFIRSIEKAHVAVSYLSERDDFPFDEVCGNLYEDYYQRLLEML